MFELPSTGPSLESIDKLIDKLYVVIPPEEMGETTISEATPLIPTSLPSPFLKATVRQTLLDLMTTAYPENMRLAKPLSLPTSSLLLTVKFQHLIHSGEFLGRKDDRKNNFLFKSSVTLEQYTGGHLATGFYSSEACTTTYKTIAEFTQPEVDAMLHLPASAGCCTIM